MKILNIIHWLWVFCFLASCSSLPKRDFKFIEIPEAINKNPEKNLAVDEVRDDISQTVFALNAVYSGKRFLPPGQFNELVKSISLISGAMTSKELCEKIDAQLDRVSDSHLNAKFNNRKCYKTVDRRAPRVGENFYKTKGEIPWFVNIQSKRNKKALLISITSFPSSTDPVWEGFIESVKKKVLRSDLIILDMRGNGGGDDSKGFELASLLAGTDLKTPYAKQWNNPAPEAIQVIVNSIEYEIRQSKEEGREAPAHLVRLCDQLIQRRNQALTSSPIADEFVNENKGHEFIFVNSTKKPIYILIDANCASSCESTTDFFEYNPLVKTVGENTAGFVHFGNNGNVFLKNSGINLRMATSYNSYVDSRYIEKTGIAPKIKVPPGKNAMDSAWFDFFENQPNVRVK